MMHEASKAAKSKATGLKKIKNKRWMKSCADLKAMSAEKSQGKKINALTQKKEALIEKRLDLRLPESITPTFSLRSAHLRNAMILCIRDGAVGYTRENPILCNITFSLHSGCRIALIGKNASGKSTLVKAIYQDPSVIKTGEWYMPKKQDIGYLDQHYTTLCPTLTVLESMAHHMPHWSHADIRRHLNDFLFRKNSDIHTKIVHLSGGEKARLSLAHIAANPPKLLILDEITNNLDLETRHHVVNILKAYLGAIIVISHDLIFLKEINVQTPFFTSKVPPFFMSV